MSSLTAKERSATVSSEMFLPTVGEYGHVPICTIVPSPYNPRKHFDDQETLEIAKKIKKGGQREIATVRELTEAERQQYSAEHPQAHYMLTSGERRYRGAKKAGLELFEVRVRGYTSRGDEMLDAFMLNEDRVQISDIESALYLSDMMEVHGWTTQEQVASAIDRDQVWVSQTLALLKCSPKVQDRLHPRHKKDSLSKQVGVFFSRIERSLQDQLIDEMPLELKTSTSQIEWVQEKLDSAGVVLPKRAQQPVSMRRTLGSLARSIEQKSRNLSTATEFTRLFENTSDEDADTLAIILRNALIELEKLVVAVEELSTGEKKVTTLIKKPALVSVSREPSVEAPPASIQSHPAKRGLVERTFTQSSGSRVLIERWDDIVGRYVTDSVSLRAYVDYWDAGVLKFQREKTSRPHSYPDRNTIGGL